MIVYSEQDFLNDAVSLSNIIDKNKYTSTAGRYRTRCNIGADVIFAYNNKE